MKRLVNSKNHGLATIVSNMVFEFIKKYINRPIKMYKIRKGIGFAWTRPDRKYSVEITSKEVKVEKKLAGGIVRYREVRLKEGIELVEKTLKEVERTF